MKLTFVTLFPDLIQAWSKEGLIAQALKRQLFSLQVINLRNYATDPHRSVDDRAFGGSDGMVFKYEPLAQAMQDLQISPRQVKAMSNESLSAESLSTTDIQRRVVYLSPQGRKWTQSEAWQWAHEIHDVVFICGRYAGVDQRFINDFVSDEISLGDFIVNGGEVPACAVAETVLRLKPGFLHNEISAQNDTFTDHLLEGPVFTRPQEIAGQKVPAVLLSGHHADVQRWQKMTALVWTRMRRPDLYSQVDSRRRTDLQLQRAIEFLLEQPEPELQVLGLKIHELQDLLVSLNRSASQP